MYPRPLPPCLGGRVDAVEAAVPAGLSKAPASADFNRFPVGPSNAAQHLVSGSTASGP